MSHIIELPDDLYRAIERYAAQRGETPEAAVLAWATSVQHQIGDAGSSEETGTSSRINNLAVDPWAGFRGRTQALSSDSLDRHDAYLAEKHMNTHERDR